MTRNDLLFDAILTPNRSLSRRGIAILMVAVCGVSFVTGLAFLLAGAWPVMCFFGLDAALLYLAFWIYSRRAAMRESLRLTREFLTVERVNFRGEKQTWRFSPAWMQVGVEEPARPDGGLVLRSHGQKLKIGRFLTLEERRDLTQALRRALIRARSACIPCAPQAN
jgi:uncharacterized membrane protein